MSEENKAIARREVEMFSTGDFSIADEIYSKDYVGHDPAKPEPIRGIEGTKEEAAGYRAAFPDLTLTIEQQVADGEYVATRWTASGTPRETSRASHRPVAGRRRQASA
jgi:predicted ester cyclase